MTNIDAMVESVLRGKDPREVVAEQVSGVAALGALREVFGMEFVNLNSREKEIAAADLVILARDESLDRDAAARMLSTNIGGPQNLKSYIASIIRNPEIVSMADLIFR